jgi:hypothetical protein
MSIDAHGLLVNAVIGFAGRSRLARRGVVDAPYSMDARYGDVPVVLLVLLFCVDGCDSVVDFCVGDSSRGDTLNPLRVLMPATEPAGEELGYACVCVCMCVWVYRASVLMPATEPAGEEQGYGCVCVCVCVCVYVCVYRAACAEACYRACWGGVGVLPLCVCVRVCMEVRVLMRNAYVCMYVMHAVCV